MRQIATAPDGTALMVTVETWYAKQPEPAPLGPAIRVFVLYEDGVAVQAQEPTGTDDEAKLWSHRFPSMAAARAAAHARFVARCEGTTFLINWRTED